MYMIHNLFKINVSFFVLLVSFFYLYLSEVSRPILFLLFYFGHISRQCRYNETSSLYVMSSYVISQQYNYVSLSEFFKEKLHKALIEKVIFGTSCSISSYTLFNRESFFKFIVFDNRLF